MRYGGPNVGGEALDGLFEIICIGMQGRPSNAAARLGGMTGMRV